MERINRKTKALLAGLAALAACASMAWSMQPLAANLYVGTLNDVNGFDGRPLPDGAHIEFRQRYQRGQGLAGWTNYPPESSWVETRNPLKATSKVGYGVIASARGRGLFASCVSGLDTTNQYVVRLFSGPTPDESVAYCDSRPFTYTADDTRSVTNVTFGIWRAMDGTPLDTATDTDGDGLADTVETLSALTDPENPDTDGDGFSDGFEYTYGMAPLVPYQLAIQLEIESPDEEACLAAGLEPESLYSLSWAALSGKTYHVEFQPSMRPSNPEDEWTVIAEEKVPVTTNRFMYNLENIEDDDIFEWLQSNSAFFRVRQMDSSSDEETASDEVPLGE